jgi:hypothetical protein
VRLSETEANANDLATQGMRDWQADFLIETIRPAPAPASSPIRA